MNPKCFCQHGTDCDCKKYENPLSCKQHKQLLKEQREAVVSNKGQRTL